MQYEAVPDRWLIFRHIEESQPDTPALEIFLVESNKVRTVSSILGKGGDPHLVSSPFIDRKVSVEKQITTVLGQVSCLSQDWDDIEDDSNHYRSPLTVLGSGNPLFADFIPHNSAAFSFHDNLTKEGAEPGSIERAKINYSVYGFFAKDALELSSKSPNKPTTPASVCWGSLYSVRYERDAAPSRIKAAEMAKLFADTQPLAVGNDVIDACVALLRGSSSKEASMAEAFEGLKRVYDGAEGDPAVFAWLLINFHNQSIQVYDKDRAFKGEVMLPAGPNESVHWHSLIGSDIPSDILPHMMRNEHDFRLQARLDKVYIPALKGSKQPMSLDELIASMSYAPFIIGLWKTIVAAQDHIQAPPAQQFAQFPSALVGRPVALAHLSLGIELATPPMQSQAYADYAEDENDSVSGVGLSETGGEELTRYEFGIKLGDMLGHQDGLIGYFTAPEADQAWNIVTDYAIDGVSLPNVKHSGDAPPLTVSPSYPPVLSSGSSELFNITLEAKNYQKRKAEALQSSLVTVFMDPFLPIHVRSGILPASQVQLNRDDVEEDLQNLGILFRSGPVIIGARGSDPVSSQDGKMRIQVVDDGNGPKGPLVPVHTMPTTTSGAEWQWVQPVMDEAEEEKNDDPLTSEVRYVHLGVTNPLKEGFDATVGADNEKAKEENFEVAVALDGYLLLGPNKKDK